MKRLYNDERNKVLICAFPTEKKAGRVHTNAGYIHCTILYDNKYFDPEFCLIDGEYTHGKITSFLKAYQMVCFFCC